MPTSYLPPAARTAGRVVTWALGVLLLLAVAAFGWVGVRGAMAVGHVTDAQDAASDLAGSLADPAVIGEGVTAVRADTAAARDLTSDPVWALMTALPWVGPQLDAVGAAIAAVDDVVASGLGPIAEVASSFAPEALRPVDGRIDTSTFVALAPAARRAADAVADAATIVERVDRTPLLPPVAAAVDEVDALLTTAATATDGLARASVLLPAMLGADEPRTHLILFQNNAEWRSLGGLVGAMALVRTEAGAMTLAAQASSSQDFRENEVPFVDLPAEVLAIYEDRPARYMHNVTQVPEFALSAELAATMWQSTRGDEIDGVFAVDPVALSYILDATGPVELPGGEVLTSETVVDLLLNEVYLRYPDPETQDAVFASAAAAVFAKIAGGEFDPAALISALATAGDERRLLMWSAVTEEQELIATTTLAGALPESTRSAARLAAYLNDSTGSKMDYYVELTPTLEWTSCAAFNGLLTLSLELTSHAPADAATSLPAAITGGGAFGTPAGLTRTLGYLYLPEGFELAGSETPGDAGFTTGTHDGRRVLSFGSELTPGATEKVEVTLRAEGATPPRAEAWVTPTADAETPTILTAGCAGS